MAWSRVRMMSVAAVLAAGGVSLGACATNDTDDRLAVIERRVVALEGGAAEVGQRTDAATQAAAQASANNAQRIDTLEQRVGRLEQMPPPARTPRN